MKRKFNFALAGGMLCLSLLAILIFRTAKELSVEAYIAVLVLYSVTALTSAVWYITVNRGFLGTRITSDMLPKEWSTEQKDAFIQDLENRRKSSKKALIILIPMIAAFFFEALDIYFLQNILSLIKK